MVMIPLWILSAYATYRVLRNREQFDKYDLTFVLVWLIGLPIAFYDFFIYSNGQGLNLILSDNIIAIILSRIYIGCSLYDCYFGAMLIYQDHFKKGEKRK